MSAFGKRFQTSMSREDLDRVNDAQKERHDAIAHERGEEVYRAERTAAYTMRWMEALVYVKTGDSLLDIGGGWVPKPLLDDLLKTRNLDYYYTDIDARSTAYVAQELVNANRLAEHAVQIDNTVVPFSDNTFDVVFSSHCLEHSLNLPVTFHEIRRALKPGGTLFMAVPFGFDTADEHLYFFEVDEWMNWLNIMGFELINVHVGRIYTYPFWDVAIVARKQDVLVDRDRAATYAARHYKLGKTVLDCSSDAFHFPAGAEKVNGSVIVRPQDGAIVIEQPAMGHLEQLLCTRQDWSGVIDITDKKNHRLVVDCYFPQWHHSAIDIADFSGKVTVRVIARNHLSHDTQIAIHGALCQMDS